jgi:hypothetical protein
MPLIPKSQGGKSLYDATTGASQIREWWTKNPTANIGLRTGITVDVIDSDDPEAQENLRQPRATGNA